MSDYSDFYNDNDGIVTDEDSPFFGLPIGNTRTTPDDRIGDYQDLLDRFGVNDLGDIIVNREDAPVENLRGNRFSNIADALLYLYEAGIVQFSNVTVDDEGEVGTEIDDDSGKSSR